MKYRFVKQRKEPDGTILIVKSPEKELTTFEYAQGERELERHQYGKNFDQYYIDYYVD